MTQHDGMTWKIEGNHFVRRKHLDEESSMYNRAIDDWIGNATIEQKKAFTKDVITGKTKFWMMFLAVVNTYIGIVSIAMPARLDFAKSFNLGSYLIIVGIVRLVIQLSESTYSSYHKEKTYFYEDEDIEEDVTKKDARKY